jgi:hypothetical protein
MDKLDIIATTDQVKIWINDLLHVQIIRNGYLGMRSHIQVLKAIQGDAWDPNFKTEKYVITFFIAGSEMVCEYKERELWESILKLLDKHL